MTAEISEMPPEEVDTPHEVTGATPEEQESFIVRNDTEEEENRLGQIRTAGATADPVKDYLKQIGKVPLLSAEMEVELAKRVEAGLFADRRLHPEKYPGEKLKPEEAARLQKLGKLATPKELDELEWLADDGRRAHKHLMEANLRLVVNLAKRYTGRGMLFLDLIQEGNLGLNRAVEKFDYSKGYKFSTYSTWWIRQSITRAIADQAHTIRIPVHMVEKINQVSRISRELLRDLDREPTPEEIAKELDIEVEDVIVMQGYARDPVSLQTPLGEDGDSELGDLIEDGGAPDAYAIYQHGALREALEAVLDTLPEREAGIIRARFGYNGRVQTLKQVGDIYGVTRERIRQIESLTMSKLKHPSRSGHLVDYLD